MLFRSDNTWGVDIADMSTWAEKNDGYTYILTMIDVFTRWAAARPMKTKSGRETVQCIQSIADERKATPQFLWVDEGKEFLNKEMNKWRSDNDVGIYHTHGEGKSAIVERFNRTLKTQMWFQLTAKNSHQWVDILPQLLEKYNKTVHGTLKMSPNAASADPAAAEKRWKELLEKEQKKPLAVKFRVGDWVRVSRQKGRFEKGYDVNWTREIFKIAKVDDSVAPATYHLVDYNGEPIEGAFYTDELQKTKLTDLFLVEKVLKRRTLKGKKQVFVHWSGWPSKFDSWLDV